MICYFTVSGLFLRTISPPFGKCNPFNMIDLDTAQEQKLQGEFRYVHSRVITHSEEIAFYSGQAKEKENVDSVYKKVHYQSRLIYISFFDTSEDNSI